MSNAVAPWPDYAGNPIHDGDKIVHPDGSEGVVVRRPDLLRVGDHPNEEWRVDYGDGGVSRLSLQIGDKGQAVVKPHI